MPIFSKKELKEYHKKILIKEIKKKFEKLKCLENNCTVHKNKSPPSLVLESVEQKIVLPLEYIKLKEIHSLHCNNIFEICPLCLRIFEKRGNSRCDHALKSHLINFHSFDQANIGWWWEQVIKNKKIIEFSEKNKNTHKKTKMSLFEKVTKKKEKEEWKKQREEELFKNFTQFHPDISISKMVKHEKKKSQQNEKFKYSDLISNIPLNVCEWALQICSSNGLKQIFKRAAKLIKTTYTREEVKGEKNNHPKAKLDKEKLIYWAEEWKKEDSHRFQIFFQTRCKRSQIFKQIFADRIIRKIEKKGRILNIELIDRLRLFKKSYAVQKILELYLKKGSNSIFDIEDQKKEACEYIWSFNSKKELMSKEQKTYMSDLVNGIFFYINEYRTLFPTINKYLLMNNISFKENFLETSLQKISSIYSIACDIYVIEQYEKQHYSLNETSTENECQFYVGKDEDFMKEYKNCIPNTWKNSKGERRNDISSFYRELLQHYNSAENTFKFYESQEKTPIGTFLSGSKKNKSPHKNKENRKLFLSNKDLKRDTKNMYEKIIEKDGIYKVTLSNGKKIEIKSLRNLLTDRFQKSLNEKVLQRNTVLGGRALTYIIFSGDGAKKGKRAINANHISCSSKTSPNYCVNERKFSKPMRFAFSFTTECRKIFEEIMKYFSLEFQKLDEPFYIEDNEKNIHEIQAIPSLFKCDRKLGHILSATFGQKDHDYPCLFCMSHISEWTNDSTCFNSPERFHNQSLRFDEALKFASYFFQVLLFKLFFKMVTKIKLNI